MFANWELDIWGRARSEREAGSQQYQAAVFDAEYARQSIAAMVAKSWILAVEARLQRALADEIVRSSEQSLKLADDRLRVGKGDEYDLTLAQANTESFVMLHASLRWVTNKRYARWKHCLDAIRRPSSSRDDAAGDAATGAPGLPSGCSNAAPT